MVCFKPRFVGFKELMDRHVLPKLLSDCSFQVIGVQVRILRMGETAAVLKFVGATAVSLNLLMMSTIGWQSKVVGPREHAALR